MNWVWREDWRIAGWEYPARPSVAARAGNDTSRHHEIVPPIPAAHPSLDLQSRATVAYVSLALGDALGATVEFMTPREIVAQYGTHDRIRGGGWLRLRRGQVTDDTTMALALGQAILTAGKIDALSIAQAFDAWMRAKPVDIGNTVRRGLVYFRKTGIPKAPPSEHDAGNGAAMRILPVALATLGQAEELVRAACRIQAHVTHHNALSDAATECLALMLQDLLNGAAKSHVLQARVEPLIDQYPQFEYRQRRRENPSGYVVETMQAVFQAFFSTDNWRDCLVDVVNRGGDADTTGAISGMLAGALYGLDGLPRGWRAELEQDSRQACKAQAQALLELAFKTGPAGT
jgi:ADP-ribosyl-[dinitrogen reductase] hydrolase